MSETTQLKRSVYDAPNFFCSTRRDSVAQRSAVMHAGRPLISVHGSMLSSSPSSLMVPHSLPPAAEYEPSEFPRHAPRPWQPCTDDAHVFVHAPCVRPHHSSLCSLSEVSLI
jgi:hypothetical protein